MEGKIGLLYLGLHNQLVKRYGINKEVRRKEFFAKLGRHYQIPKDLRYYIIKEMVDLHLIEKVNGDIIKILPCKINIEEDKKELFRKLNICN